MSLLLYNLSIRLYRFGIGVSSLSNEKAKSWIVGRRDWRQHMAGRLQPGECRIWIHCSSLGEFEQGRPLIELIRKRYPDYKIVLTFFSPSGYEPRKNYDGADYVFYLPMDSAANARDFIGLVQPALALFVKYEFWYHYLSELKGNNIPTLLVSAAFRANQPFFQRHGSLFRTMLHCFTHLHVQDAASAELLRSIGISQNVSVTGDTRYDRVAAIRAGIREIPEAVAFRGDCKILIAGSSWPEDETILRRCLNDLPPDWKLIIAPHEIDVSHINQLKDLFGDNAVTFSVLHMERAQASRRVLIIDNMGMLSSLYAYGNIAWVGGGFRKGGIHNTLEPAVFGTPIIMGPVYKKFVEAVKLVELGAAFPVADAEGGLHLITQLIADETRRKDIHQKLEEFMSRETGAAERILGQVQRDALL
ncbi:MAG: 3-deoxy-D-manno-octulosonic acid transferase [Taibaiella sp.]|nr:3-deoxy-D-manno-octulosonic acid transferase [Taibaiella sp.]